MRTAIVDHVLDPAALLAEVASTASGASTLIDCQWVTGQPLRGCRMWQ